MASQLQTNLESINEGVEILNNYAYAILSHTEYTVTPYTELGYIESTGIQYIDTGITLSATNYRVELDYQLIALENNTFFCGMDMDFEAGYYGNKLYTSAGFTYTNSSNPSHRGVATGVNTKTSSKSIYIFARNWTGNLNITKMKVYSCKIYNNLSVLVRDLIPVRRLSDNEICMYDKVTEQFFTNAGTGEFVAGPAQGEKPYIELEYIQSTGTQYINSNYIPKSTSEFDFVFYKDTSGGYNDYEQAFGVREGGNTTGNGYWGWCTGLFYYYYKAKKIAYYNDGGEKYSYDFNMYNTKVKFVSAGTSATVTNLSTNDTQTLTTSVKVDCRYPIMLFSGATAASMCDISKNLRIYYFKIYEENTLVRDIIPVKRKSDNVVCLYDKVTGTFLTNSGTGVFIAGPELV